MRYEGDRGGRPTSAERAGVENSRARILNEWAKGKFAPEIARELGLSEGMVHGVIGRRSGPEAEKASADHYRNKAMREGPKYRSRESIDREAMMLNLWADGASAGDIAAEFHISRNIVTGVIYRSKGENAEAAKRMHIAQRGSGRVTVARPRRQQGLAQPKPVEFDARANPSKQVRAKPAEQHKGRRILSPQALAERREKQAAIGLALVAKVELRLIDNPAFVKVEKAIDLYSHMRSDKSFHDAMAALTR
jgi:DNA-binding CsgD family transcriptional regulator